MSVKRPFTLNPVLTAIALSYRNETLIADAVAPRVTVPGEQFKYTVHRKEQFRVVDDAVGRTGRVNELEFGADQADGSVRDHGIETPIPMSDINQAGAAGGVNFDPKANAVVKQAKIIALNRERRVSNIVFSAATYPTGNKVQLSGTDQWSDFTNSDPVDDIMGAMDGMLIRPNNVVIGYAAWAKLRMSPIISKAIVGTADTGKVATLQEVADLFEVDNILIGRAWNNTAKEGQAESMARVWGKHCALLYIDGTPTDTDEITFMITAQHGDKVSGEMDDPNIGLRGGVRVRTGETVREIVLAADVGYLIEDAVA